MYEVLKYNMCHLCILIQLILSLYPESGTILRSVSDPDENDYGSPSSLGRCRRSGSVPLEVQEESTL